ncbi:MAG: hypothetical protein GF393_04170 [Armatimonadia bacterium]|nr:hypothetical protein [Armatimonadia bacterium]
MNDNGRDFWRCFAGSVFGFALALVLFKMGFWPFVVTALLTIIGGIGGWFFGRIFS